MKKIISTMLIIAVSAVILLSQSAKIRLAVSGFNDTITRETELEKTGKNLSAELEKLYTAVTAFQVRESGAIQKYLDNLKSVQLGLTDDLFIKGKSDSLLVDYLVFGTVSSIDGKYNVDTRVVNIDSWKIVKSYGITCTSVDEAIGNIQFSLIDNFNQSLIDDRESLMKDSPTVAVFTFKDDNSAAMHTRYSTVFTEMLNSVLGSFQMINTIERTYTKTLIQEKVLEMVGVTENSSVNRKDVMDIQYKLTGGFRVFKDVITVNYKLEKISNGQVIYMGTRDISSSSSLRRVCESISNIIEDVLANRIGTLKLDSIPHEADVFIDDEPMGKTPLLIPVPKGNHNLTIKMDGFETHKSSITIEPQSILDKNIKLEALSRQLLNEAYNLERRGNIEGAIKLYDEFIIKYGEATEVNEALYRKGHLLISLKRYNDAVNTFDSLVKKYPDALTRAEAYFGLAKSYYLMGDLARAKATKSFLLERFGETYTAEEARRTFSW
ncbi:MAG TPA: PEGA domain-containing protein [Spirochaetota bacterium]|nr:PEGA domain-containing protein [Spirochaetota bacterium]